jgi:hypothetical protein
MRTLALLTTLVLSLATLQSHGARYNIELNFGDTEIEGTNVIHLKRAIQRAHPNIDLRRMELLATRLVAKSRSGKGAAYLAVGRDQTASKRIDGNTVKWYLDAEQTFDRVDFQNPSRRAFDSDPWQIVLGGRIKVRRVIVALEDNWSNPRDPRDPRQPRDPRDPRRE